MSDRKSASKGTEMSSRGTRIVKRLEAELAAWDRVVEFGGTTNGNIVVDSPESYRKVKMLLDSER